MGQQSAAAPALNAQEKVWRRFDLRDPAHFDNVTVDESSGVERLKGGALRFDHDGCSVYIESVLRRINLAPMSIGSRQYAGLAYAIVAEVAAFSSGLSEAEGQEFGVVPDPLEPDPPYNPAHALITEHGAYASNSKRRQARNQLARRVFKTM